jgi:hypothetical protein
MSGASVPLSKGEPAGFRKPATSLGESRPHLPGVESIAAREIDASGAADRDP